MFANSENLHCVTMATLPGVKLANPLISKSLSLIPRERQLNQVFRRKRGPWPAFLGMLAGSARVRELANRGRRPDIGPSGLGRALLAAPGGTARGQVGLLNSAPSRAGQAPAPLGCVNYPGFADAQFLTHPVVVNYRPFNSEVQRADFWR